MKQETKKPVYKVLNEQRLKNRFFDSVKGIGFSVDIGEFAGSYSFLEINERGVIMGDVNPDKIEPSLEFMALAYNNLSLLAEALENIANNTSDGEAKRLATQALNRIS